MQAEGCNELPSDRHPGLLGSLSDVLREPMFLLLVGAAAIYLLLGSLREALVLSVPEAVQECYAAGIRVVMITGDHPHTAQSVARQIALRALFRVAGLHGMNITLCLVAGLLSIVWFEAVKVVKTAKAD
jgi:hypothetical protein